MSNSIARSKKQETLKQLIRDLHAGKTVDQVKATFAELVKDVSPAEIAELEQGLIAEGMPESEVKRLCDVHVQVFRESLDAQVHTRPETIPGHPVHTFMAENAATGPVLDEVQAALETLQTQRSATALDQARKALVRLRLLEKHYLRKENLLFPFLEKHGFSGPSSVMWAIHDDIRGGWKSLEKLLTAELGDDLLSQIREQWASLQTAIREMVYKEEQILYPAALQALSSEEWAEIRRQEAEIGYAYVEPGRQWLPVVMASPENGVVQAPIRIGGTPTIGPQGADLALDTGTLSTEQINLILTHLPVEITFVDENDEVRYFSQGKEQIFPRTAAIIGREVQKCHPPDSLDKVQRILDDFRAGRRDVAEFWIQMRGMAVYIRYYAVRDAQGRYRGTMEVTQEISHIRQLEGERRLLDD